MVGYMVRSGICFFSLRLRLGGPEPLRCIICYDKAFLAELILFDLLVRIIYPLLSLCLALGVCLLDIQLPS